MKIRTLALLLFIMTGCCAAPDTIPEASALMAPDFSLETLDGSRFSLSKLRGKPIVLIFGATWCSYCKEEIPQLKKIHKKYGRKIRMAAIYFNEPHIDVYEYALINELPYPLLLDYDAAVTKAYGVLSLPVIAVINADGSFYSLPSDDLEGDLKKILKD